MSDEFKKKLDEAVDGLSEGWDEAGIEDPGDFDPDPGSDRQNIGDGDYNLVDGAAWFSIGGRSIRLRKVLHAGTWFIEAQCYRMGKEDEDPVEPRTGSHGLVFWEGAESDPGDSDA